MPYANVPKAQWGKMDRCVARVMANQKGLTKNRAVAICHKSVVGGDKRDLSFTDRTRLVQEAWQAEYGGEYSGAYGGYVMGVYEEYLVVRRRGKLFKVGYTMEKTDVTFQEPNEWVEVEMEFMPVRDRIPVMIPIRAVPGEAGRYQGYAVRFTDEEERDLFGTWFDGDTNYCLDFYEQWPWLHQHGRHSKVGARRVGVWDTFGLDETGVFIQGELDASEKYREALEVLLDEEVLFTSSQALSSMVKVGPDGHVDVWPIGEVSSTVSPADFRGQPISAAAERAVAMLSEQPTERDGGDSMTAKDKVLKLVDQIFGEDDDEEPTAAAGDGEGEGAEPGEGGGEGTRAVTVEDVVAEVAKALPLATFRDAIEALDGTVRELAERLAAMEQHTSQTEAERVKTVMAGDDWLSRLFVATRDAEPVADADGGEGEEVPSDSGDGRPLGEGETVWGRMNEPAA